MLCTADSEDMGFSFKRDTGFFSNLFNFRDRFQVDFEGPGAAAGVQLPFNIEEGEVIRRNTVFDPEYTSMFVVINNVGLIQNQPLFIRAMFSGRIKRPSFRELSANFKISIKYFPDLPGADVVSSNENAIFNVEFLQQWENILMLTPDQIGTGGKIRFYSEQLRDLEISGGAAEIAGLPGRRNPMMQFSMFTNVLTLGPSLTFTTARTTNIDYSGIIAFAPKNNQFLIFTPVFDQEVYFPLGAEATTRVTHNPPLAPGETPPWEVKFRQVRILPGFFGGVPFFTGWNVMNVESTLQLEDYDTPGFLMADVTIFGKPQGIGTAQTEFRIRFTNTDAGEFVTSFRSGENFRPLAPFGVPLITSVSLPPTQVANSQTSSTFVIVPSSLQQNPIGRQFFTFPAISNSKISFNDYLCDIFKEVPGLTFICNRLFPEIGLPLPLPLVPSFNPLGKPGFVESGFKVRIQRILVNVV